MKTININNWSLSELFSYANTPKNYHVLKEWTHLRQTKSPDVFKRELVELALVQQYDDIQQSVVLDAIQFVGLHKLIDFNIFNLSYKKCLFALFTKYCDYKLKRYALDISNAINSSIEHNVLQLLNEDEIKELITYTELRCKHIKALNDLVSPVVYSKFNGDYYTARCETEKAYNMITDSFEYNLFFYSDEEISDLEAKLMKKVLSNDDFLVYEKKEFLKSLDNLLEITNEC